MKLVISSFLSLAMIGFAHAECTQFVLWNADTDNSTGYFLTTPNVELCQQVWGFTIEAKVDDCLGINHELKYAKLTMVAPTLETKHFEGREPLTFFGDFDEPDVTLDVTGLEMMQGDYIITSKSFATNTVSNATELLEEYQIPFTVVDCGCVVDGPCPFEKD